jgi:cytochrome c-type biogenesis protein
MNLTLANLAIAFAAGLASFLSPCVLPLVPIYLAQLAGPSVYQSTGGPEGRSQRLMTFIHASMFVLGFTVMFVALGATASVLGQFLSANQFLLRQVGGVLLVLIGLHMTGILKLPFLYWQKRIEFHPERPGYLASLLIGIIFGVAWSPCYGPILGTILVMAGTSATLRQGMLLLLVYSLGLGIPFLLLGLGLGQVSRVLKWLKPHLGKIEFVTGLVMITAGVLIFFNLFAYLNTFFNQL